MNEVKIMKVLTTEHDAEILSVHEVFVASFRDTRQTKDQHTAIELMGHGTYRCRCSMSARVVL